MFKSGEVVRLRSLLRRGVLEIDFVKKNGEDRKILASTNPLYIPDYDPEEEPQSQSDSYVNVIDTEIGEWRRINYDSIKSYRSVSSPALAV